MYFKKYCGFGVFDRNRKGVIVICLKDENLNVDFDNFFKEDNEVLDEWLVLPKPMTNRAVTQVYAENVSYPFTNDIYEVSTKTGQYLFQDNRRNCMFSMTADSGKRRDNYYCTGRFVKMKKVKVGVCEDKYDTYFFVSIVDKHGHEKEVLISEADLNTPGKVFNVFSQEGIVFSKHRSNRDSLELLLKYLYSNIIDEHDVYNYKPGWYDGEFKYSNGEHIANTPFFCKKLAFDESIPQAAAARKVIMQVKSVAGNEPGFIFLIIQHYAIVVSLIPEKYRLKKPIVIYGKSYDIEIMANMLFRFYNRDINNYIDLSDKSIPGCFDGYKDEVVLVSDYANVGYRKKAAVSKYYEIKNYIKDSRCKYLCMILSDCGVVEANEDNIHIMAAALKANSGESDKNYLPTHIKYFTDWIRNKKINIITKSDSENAEYDSIINMFYTVFDVISRYFLENANIDITDVFGLEDSDDVYAYISHFVHDSLKYMGGSWMCEFFKSEYLKLRNTGKIQICTQGNISFDCCDDKLVVLDNKDEIMIRSVDFSKFVEAYPDNVRRKDVLTSLRDAGLLITDGKDRFTKNKFIGGEVVDMIAVKKKYLEPDYGDI